MNKKSAGDGDTSSINDSVVQDISSSLALCLACLKEVRFHKQASHSDETQRSLRSEIRDHPKGPILFSIVKSSEDPV